MTSDDLKGRDGKPINAPDLLDPSTNLISFAKDPANYVPGTGSIIFSVWNKKREFLYIGISGTQLRPADREHLTRMRSCWSGTRGGNQFCNYIRDTYIVPTLQKGEHDLSALAELTKEYIRENLSYKFAYSTADDSRKIVQDLRKQIINGDLDPGRVPKLNRQHGASKPKRAGF